MKRPRINAPAILRNAVQQELRLECLKIAGCLDAGVLDAAKRYYDWVLNGTATAARPALTVVSADRPD
jgi:hypothetical protein